MSHNRLGGESSPYLRQHKDNPVHWRPWSPEAFAAAKAEVKPVLLSVGYAACHWCHVMAHESFEDAATAAVMNDLFINIKVDREERPDVDSIYQHALALLGQPGGWPLTMFLTPAGEPFWGGTYFPPAPAYGRPGFRDILQRVAEVYRSDPESVQKNVTAIKSALGALSTATPGTCIEDALVARGVAQALGHFDPSHGGLKGAPKFPQASLLRLLWHDFARRGRAESREAVTLALTRMSQGGIYDHLGGGFARYSVDAEWLVPHFEKMLYDNAQLVELLTLVWQESREPLFAGRVAETVGWLLREMRIETRPGRPTGFAGTLDADSDGEEGRFYVWTEAEIDRLLGADAPLFKRVYDVTGAGNWEGKTILNRIRPPARRSNAEEAALARARAALLAAREARVRPGRDDKLLADWNGLAIAALARAGAVFARAEWIAAAKSAFAFVAAAMSEGDRLRHSWCEGAARHPGVLDDYANMARAGAILHEVTGDPAPLAWAERWAGAAERHFWDRTAGGYFLSADDVDDVIVRTKSAADQAVPSGNGVMAEALARLFHLTGKPAYRARAAATIAAFAGDAPRQFLAFPGLIIAQEILENAVHVVIAGEEADPARIALLEAVHGCPAPTLVLSLLGPGVEMPPGHPAHGKGPVAGRAAAYVCAAGTCSLPLTEPAALAVEIAARRRGA